MADTAELEWRRCGKDQHWCPLFEVVFDDDLKKVSGVYCIFQKPITKPGLLIRHYRTIYVGQGNIAECINRLRGDPTITHKYGELYVTWAKTLSSQTNGIERYLTDTLHPLECWEHPTAYPIAVNLPYPPPK